VKGATNLKGNTTSIDSGNKINVYFPFVEDAEEDLSPLPEFPPPGGILYKLPPPSRKESISRQRLSLPILPTTIYKRPSLEDFDSNPDTNTIEMKWLKGKGKAKEGSNDADAGPSGPEMSQVQGTTNMTTSQGQAATATNSLAEASSNTTSSQAHGSASMSASQGQVPFTTLTPEQASANAAANAAGVAIATANVLAAVTADLASSSISTPAPAPAPDSGIREPRSPERCFPGFGLYKNVSGEAQVWYVGIRHMLKYGIHQLEFAGGMYKVCISLRFHLLCIHILIPHPPIYLDFEYN
jgi:hypothetical protein